MGAAEKATFLNEIEQEIKSYLTAENMNMVLRTVADRLQGFEMLQLAKDTTAQDDLLKIYVDAMRIEGRSELTVRRYEYIIGRLMAAIQVQTRQVTVYHLRNWLAKEKARGISDSTLEGYRQVFSAYFNWLQRENLIERNPAANLGVIKQPKKKKQVYSPVDIEKLDNSCLTVRDRAILAFLRSTGCRISEMTGLNRDSVDLKEMKCTVLGKGNKERTVYLDPVACMLIQEYLESRKDDYEALFIGKRRERLRPNGVRAMLKGLADRAGVEHVHPHKFRRTLATNLIRHGMPLQEVANILGHEKLDTTMEYVVMNNDDIQHSYRRFYT